MPHTDEHHVHDGPPPDNPEVHHEHSDVNVRGILIFVGSLLALGIVIHVALWGLFRYFESRERAADPTPAPLAAARPVVPPTPRLQTAPRLAYDDFLRRQQDSLSSYGWIDQSAGVVRIPIDRAMQIITERGMPTGGPWTPTQPHPHDGQAPHDSSAVQHRAPK